MITYMEGDLFESPAQTLVNPVNIVGVMGKGLALEFKKRYPKMFDEYKKQCDNRQLVVWRPILWKGEDHWILNFPTKRHWKDPSQLIFIEVGLSNFVRLYELYEISSIAFPKLGCGNGGLDWEDVKPIMEKHLQNLPIDIYIYI